MTVREYDRGGSQARQLREPVLATIDEHNDARHRNPQDAVAPVALVPKRDVGAGAQESQAGRFAPPKIRQS